MKLEGMKGLEYRHLIYVYDSELIWTNFNL
jgi:hypothetical protein